MEGKHLKLLHTYHNAVRCRNNSELYDRFIGVPGCSSLPHSSILQRKAMWPPGSDITVDVCAWWDVVPAAACAHVSVP